MAGLLLTRSYARLSLPNARLDSCLFSQNLNITRPRHHYLYISTSVFIQYHVNVVPGVKGQSIVTMYFIKQPPVKHEANIPFLKANHSACRQLVNLRAPNQVYIVNQMQYPVSLTLVMTASLIHACCQTCLISCFDFSRTFAPYQGVNSNAEPKQQLIQSSVKQLNEHIADETLCEE